MYHETSVVDTRAWHYETDSRGRARPCVRRRMRDAEKRGTREDSRVNEPAVASRVDGPDATRCTAVRRGPIGQPRASPSILLATWYRAHDAPTANERF